MRKFDSLLIGKVFLFCLVLISFTACNKEKKVHEENLDEIEQYISDNNLMDVQSTESGLHYIVTRPGDGNFPTVSNDVEVNYKGYFTDKSVFDDGQNVEFPLSGVIKGWQEGIPKFSRGGSGILLIPAKLGYGLNDTPSIPGGSVLIFEVDLVDFK